MGLSSEGVVAFATICIHWAVSCALNQPQRMQREREAWREIQTERDALLEEKHRWALVRCLLLVLALANSTN